MNSKTKSWFLLILLAIIWGSSFILMKKSMFDANGNELLSANEVGALRIFISGVVLLFVFFKHIKTAFSKHAIFLFLVGVLGNFGPALLFTHAQQTLSSSLTGILNSLVPIFSVIVASLVFKHNISIKAIGGILIGLVGTVFLIYFSKNGNGTIELIPVLMVVFATVCYAFSLNIIKNKLTEVSSFAITAISLVFMIIPSIITLGFTDIIEKVNNPTYYPAFGYTTLLAVVGTAFALVIFNELIKLTTSVFASSVTYLIPIVAILWGVYFNEPISWGISFAALIIVGVVIVKKEEQKRVKRNEG
ncbi:MAG: DMT family transporter [Flavobacteriales bacterium]